MHRVTLFLALLALFPVPALQAQMSRDPAYIYEAYYRVSPGDIAEWNKILLEHGRPILDDLQAKGVIQGWSEWQHQTWGDYNVRFTARTYDWASIDTFWEEYLTQLNASLASSEYSGMARMIEAHMDEIWDVSLVDVPDGYEPNYMYASTYQYDFADGAEWHRLWNDVASPIFREAMTAGLLGGFVLLDHNTGGAQNYKVLFLFDEWDDIDNFFEKVGVAMEEQHASDWETFQKLTVDHSDNVWGPTRPEGM